MADLDQTIEELEKEVTAELEEAAHDAPTKGSGKSDPMPKMKNGEKPEEIPGPTPVSYTHLTLPTTPRV